MSADKPLDVRVAFKIQGVESKLHVLNFQAEEGLSRLYQLEVDLACESSDLSFEQIMGSKALFGLKNDQGTHFLHGIVCRFSLLERARNHTIYHATVVPRAWRLLHRHDCRIFQNKSIKEIVQEVLQKAGVDHTFRVKGNQPLLKREQCVQYRESDWNFVCRLLEEEGFFYYFEHEQGKHTLHIGNDLHLHPKIPGLSTLGYHDGAPLTVGAEHIFSWRYEENIRTGKVTLNDYNFQKPALDQKEDDKAERDADLEDYDYPGLYELPPAGKGLAGIRLEEQQVPLQLASGRSDSIRLRSGYSFTLDGHHRKALNDKEYLLTRVHHVGEKHDDLEGGAISNRIRYSNSFSVIPRATPYRPPRVTPKPFVQGAQTAVVVGPPGEEIYTDKHGRVKVHFHWDRLDKRNQDSSCWIRVSQLWAGQGWGAMFIPRIGQEVIVDFLEGDPDRPIITGRVYHAQNVPPYGLPAEKTKSTIKSNSTPGGGGSNELRFEDKKGQEQVYIHAEKDQDQVIENDHTIKIGNDQTRTIEHNRTTTIVDGDDTFTIKKGDQVLTLKSGDQTVSVTGKIAIDATSSITLTCGASTIKLDPGKIAINAPLVKINC